MKKSLYLSIGLLLMFVGVFAFTNCGSDEHAAEFDNEAQGSPEDVSLLLRMLQYGYQDDNYTKLPWRDFLSDKVFKAEVRAVARVYNCPEEVFDGKLCCFLCNYLTPSDNDTLYEYKNEYTRFFCPLPANATKEQFAIGSTVSFRIKRYAVLKYYTSLPNEWAVEIELVNADDITE